MLKFDFSKKVVKSLRKKVSPDIIHKKVEGVIYLDENDVYKVLYENKLYDIVESNFSCKGVKTVYSTKLTDTNRRLCYVRLDTDLIDLNAKHYLPFAVGVVVVGNVITKGENFKEMFDIKRVLRGIITDDSKKIFKHHILRHEQLKETV